MIEAPDPISPHLTSLNREVAAGDREALDRFWQTLRARGAPLIEADEDKPGHSLVTFIWRGAEGTEEVAVRVAVDGTGEDEHPLARLPSTDLWYATFRLPDEYRGAYKFLVSGAAGSQEAVEEPDPLNPRTFIEPKDEERADHQEDDVDSLVALPAAPEAPWALPRAGIANGRVTRHQFRSRLLGNDRRVWVYTSPQYNTLDERYPLAVVLDGRFFTFAVGVPHILDNLLADGEISPLVAVMVDNPGSTWQQSMAIREEELSCYPPFSDFLAQELVPWLQDAYHVTKKPRRITLAGGSVGALAAAFVAHRHPGTFGNVIAMSGSFWWKPDGDGEWEWLARQFARSTLLRLRFYLAVGLLESGPSPTGFPGQLLANRHLRNVLQARGYEVHYEEGMYGHDASVWPEVLPQGLIRLTR